MSREVVRYLADDDTEWLTPEEADAHNADLAQNAQRIEEERPITERFNSLVRPAPPSLYTAYCQGYYSEDRMYLVKVNDDDDVEFLKVSRSYGIQSVKLTPEMIEKVGFGKWFIVYYPDMGCTLGQRIEIYTLDEILTRAEQWLENVQDTVLDVRSSIQNLKDER